MKNLNEEYKQYHSDFNDIVKLFVITILFLLLCAKAYCTNYYFSNAGNDANAGTTSAAPWQTITKFNATTFVAGDNVYFNRGDAFYGGLLVTNSGTSGNPIFIGAYGTGAQPIITGLTNVTAWTNIGTNIWESTSAVSTLNSCHVVVINGVNTAEGRFPNVGATGTSNGYLFYQSHATNTAITSSSLTGTPNWTGADVVIKKTNWIIDIGTITSQSAGTLNYTTGQTQPTYYDGQDGWGFFIQNDSLCLDIQNEWYYNPTSKKLRIYSTSSPTGVQMATVDTLFKTLNNSYLTVDNISFTFANKDALVFWNFPNMTVQNCTFNYIGMDAVKGDWYGTSPNGIINNNNFSNVLNSSIVLIGGGVNTNSTIINNTINNNALIIGQGRSDDGASTALNTQGDFGLVQNNSITNCGSVGISFGGKSKQVLNNFVNTCLINKADGGAIYSGGVDSLRVISNNILINCGPSNNDGEPGTSHQANGIYFDGSVSTGVTCTNNGVYNVDGLGIFLRDSHGMTITGNNVLKCSYGALGGINDDPTDSMHNLVITNNVFTNTSGNDAYHLSTKAKNLSGFGTIDSNVVARPIDDNLDILVEENISPGYFFTHYTLASFNSTYGYEAHGTKSPKTITTDADLLFVYNFSNASVTQSLPFNYMDMKGNTYNGTITLPAWSSKTLIKNGAITDGIYQTIYHKSRIQWK